MKNYLIAILFLFTLNTSVIAEVKTLRIGALLPLSGKLAFLGAAEQRGIQLAVSHYNKNVRKQNNLQLEVFFEDTEGDPRKAVLALQFLLQKDIDVIISSSTPVTTSIAPIIAQRKKILFYAATSREITKQSNLFFRDYFDAEDQGTLIGKSIVQRNHHRVAYLGEENDACTIYKDAIRKELSSDFISVETYTPGSEDHSPLLLKIKNKNPEAVALCTYKDTSTLMRRLNTLGMLGIQTFHLVAPFLPSSDTPEIRKLLEENKAITTWYANAPEEESKEVLTFEKEFKARFGEEPRGDSRFLYDDIIFLAEAFENCEIKDYSCAADYLKNRTFSGVAGELRFDESGVSKRADRLQEVKNGEWVTIVSNSLKFP